MILVLSAGFTVFFRLYLCKLLKPKIMKTIRLLFLTSSNSFIARWREAPPDNNKQKINT